MKSNIYTIFVFLICLILTYFGNEHYQQQRFDETHQDVTIESLTISHNIQQQLSNHTKQLQLIAQSWHSSKEINARWVEDSNNIKRLNPYAEEVKIYNFNKLQTLTIEEKNYVRIDKHQNAKPLARYIVNLPTEIIDRQTLFISPPFSLANKAKAIYVHIPIFIEKELFAYLQVTLNLTRLLTHQVNIFQLDHPFSISNNGIEIFSKLPNKAHINQVNAQVAVPIFKQNWKLMVWSDHLHELDKYIVYIGLLVTLLISINTHLFVQNRHLQKQISANKIQLGKIQKAVKRKDSKLIQSNKLTSLGEMATGLAHEINQPLQTICIHADLCTENLHRENYKLVEKDFRAILLQIDRIEKIVKQVGSFGRDSELNNYSEEQPIDIFASVISIIINQYKQEQVELRQVLPTSLPAIFCNKIQIEQVLVNLLINAKDSVEACSTKIVFIKAHTKEANLYIEVSDTGTGIENEKLDDIFTPFYTTKALGKGTGLGLSISYSIIEQHKGELRVHSEVGKGTTFTVILPLYQKYPEQVINQLS